MLNKDKLLTGLVTSIVGMSQTARGDDVQSTATQPALACDDNTREFVLTADNPLFYCPVDAELNDLELLQCKKILTCIFEEGIFVDSSTLVKFAVSGVGETESCKRITCVPVKTQ